MDILQEPIVVLLLGLLALPGVTSFIAGVLKRVQSTYDINPRVIVYAVSLVITGLVLWLGDVDVPAYADDPAAFVAAWVVWTTANAELARRLYEALWETFAADW